MSGDKKARQQRAKAAVRAQAVREWEEHMVLEPAQLKDLLDLLHESLGRLDCDHSLRLTRAWARDNGIDQAALERSVLHFGEGATARSWRMSTRRRK